MFYIERELHMRFPEVSIKSLICNITDKIRVGEIFKEYKPQVVIHAAAHKHVPLMEVNADGAVTVNIIGTQNLIEASDRHGVK